MTSLWIVQMQTYCLVPAFLSFRKAMHSEVLYCSCIYWYKFLALICTKTPIKVSLREMNCSAHTWHQKPKKDLFKSWKKQCRSPPCWKCCQIWAVYKYFKGTCKIQFYSCFVLVKSQSYSRESGFSLLCKMTDMAFIFWLEKDRISDSLVLKRSTKQQGKVPVGILMSHWCLEEPRFWTKFIIMFSSDRRIMNKRTALAYLTFCGSIVIHDSEMYVQIYVCAVGFHHAFH